MAEVRKTISGTVNTFSEVREGGLSVAFPILGAQVYLSDANGDSLGGEASITDAMGNYSLVLETTDGILGQHIAVETTDGSKNFYFIPQDLLDSEEANVRFDIQIKSRVTERDPNLIIVKEKENIYVQLLEGIEILNSLNIKIRDKKNDFTEEELKKMIEERDSIQSELNEYLAKEGGLDKIEANLRQARKEYISNKVTVVRGGGLKLDDRKIAEAKESKPNQDPIFKIEIDAESVRSFQNENIYVSIDLSQESEVAIMLPSIKSLNNNLNVNIWVSDVSRNFRSAAYEIDGGGFTASGNTAQMGDLTQVNIEDIPQLSQKTFQIIADEDENDTIAGLPSVEIMGGFSGALITPISNRQWAIFYAQNLSIGSYQKGLNLSVDDIKNRLKEEEIFLDGDDLQGIEVVEAPIV